MADVQALLGSFDVWRPRYPKGIKAAKRIGLIFEYILDQKGDQRKSVFVATDLNSSFPNYRALAYVHRA